MPSLNLTQVTKIAKIGNIAKVNRAIPDDYLVAIAKKNSEVPSNTTQLSKLLNDLAEFLGNKAKGQRFNGEIKAVLDEAVGYIKRNKKTFLLVDKVDNAILPLIKILNKNPGYVKCVELVKGKHGRHLGQWIAVESEAIVKLYTANIYIRLNKALRGIDNVELDKELKAMQKVLDDALEKLPVSTHNNEILQRSVFLTEKEIKTMFKAGKDYTEKGFMSTTYSERALMQWLIDNPTHNVIFKVQGKNGKLIEKASMLPMENEVLFKSGTKFFVESVNKGARHPLDKNKIIEIILKEK